MFIRKARYIHTYYEVVHRCTGAHQSASVREDVDSYIGRAENEGVLILRHEYADGGDFVHGAEEYNERGLLHGGEYVHIGGSCMGVSKYMRKSLKSLYIVWVSH